jgi:hypothetical protein
MFSFLWRCEKRVWLFAIFYTLNLHRITSGSFMLKYVYYMRIAKRGYVCVYMCVCVMMCTRVAKGSAVSCYTPSCLTANFSRITDGNVDCPTI